MATTRCVGALAPLARGFASGRSKRGLFAGKDVLFGNNVSHSQRKTRRKWKPNVQRKRLYSEALGEQIRFNVTTHALRCIDKAGGLDNYLTALKPADLVDEKLLATRQAIIDVQKNGGSNASAGVQE